MTTKKKDSRGRKQVGTDEVDPRLIIRALTGGSPPVVSKEAARAIARAAEDVINELQIEDFIDTQWEKIDRKLVECDEYADAAATFGGDLIFISMATPLVNGVIHVGSTRERLERAIEDVTQGQLQKVIKDISKEWNRPSLTYAPERIPIISALTLIYLVTKGWNRVMEKLDEAQKSNASKKELKELGEAEKRWGRMLDRVRHMCNDRAGGGGGQGQTALVA